MKQLNENLGAKIVLLLARDGELSVEGVHEKLKSSDAVASLSRVQVMLGMQKQLKNESECSLSHVQTMLGILWSTAGFLGRRAVSPVGKRRVFYYRATPCGVEWLRSQHEWLGEVSTKTAD